MERQTKRREWTLPPWTKLITGGIDVQENCPYWTIRAWGDYMTSQERGPRAGAFHGRGGKGHERGVFPCRTATRPWSTWPLMDKGDQTDEVYEFCAINSDWVLPCKGTSTMLSHYRLSVVNKAGSKATA